MNQNRGPVYQETSLLRPFGNKAQYPILRFLGRLFAPSIFLIIIITLGRISYLKQNPKKTPNAQLALHSTFIFLHTITTTNAISTFFLYLYLAFLYIYSTLLLITLSYKPRTPQHTHRNPNIPPTMAKHSAKIRILVFLVTLFMSSCLDSNPLQDFCVADTAKPSFEINGLPCKDPATAVAADFKSSLLIKPGNTSNSLGSALTIATASSFPALNTQGLSFARIDYAAKGTVQPHYHPRASEVLFIVKGSLYAGFIDTQNKLFAARLGEGEMFVFPQGMVHFIHNVGNRPAVTLSSLNSQNPGAVLVAKSVFGSNPSVPDNVLAAAFRIPVSEVRSIKTAISRPG